MKPVFNAFCITERDISSTKLIRYKTKCTQRKIYYIIYIIILYYTAMIMNINDELLVLVYLLYRLTRHRVKVKVKALRKQWEFFDFALVI